MPTFYFNLLIKSVVFGDSIMPQIKLPKFAGIGLFNLTIVMERAHCWQKVASWVSSESASNAHNNDDFVYTYSIYIYKYIYKEL